MMFSSVPYADMRVVEPILDAIDYGNYKHSLALSQKALKRKGLENALNLRVTLPLFDTLLDLHLL
jgi:hypothetical protein